MTHPDPDFSRFAASRAHQACAHRLIPGGAHTYAKGDDQMPEWMPVVIDRGEGAFVWDLDGNRFIEYGQGLRSVTLGHAEPRVTAAATRELARGTNFSRPSRVELEAAEAFLALIGAECVKFCKDGSSATTAAVKVARAATGRDTVAVCSDHPFLSQGDWFIGTTPMAAGIPRAVRDLTVGFPYGDVAALEAVLDEHRPACVVMEAVRDGANPTRYLRACIAACRARGVVFVLDEMITGFRWSARGAQGLYGLDPDLSTFGKALANGHSVSALAGRRDLMEAGGLGSDRDRVFLLSGTHGAETHGLAAAIAALRIARDENVAGRLMRQGARLRKGVAEVVRERLAVGSVGTAGRDSNLVFYTRDADGRPSQAYRTLFVQELARRGVLAPSFVITTAHTDDVIDQTVEAVAGAVDVYVRALDAGSVDGLLIGRPVQPVFRKKAGTVWTSVSRSGGDGAVSPPPRLSPPTS
ncbi:glutamate-1-semialdehyde 2,1-aminomutase [Rubrivirga sp.]|uniref:glutamate-1-semialdehyde 2,1-aminomutase n=1 Tax=Rubrivirga sp. TaxID=1885344 RepID=UPI003B518178